MPFFELRTHAGVPQIPEIFILEAGNFLAHALLFLSNRGSIFALSTSNFFLDDLELSLLHGEEFSEEEEEGNENNGGEDEDQSNTMLGGCKLCRTRTCKNFIVACEAEKETNHSGRETRGNG